MEVLLNNKKKCNICGLYLEDSNFYKCGNGKKRPACINCWNFLRRKRRKESDTIRQKEKAYRDKHKAYYHAHNIKNRYNITYEEYLKLEKIQNSMCAICKKPEKIMFNNKICKLSIDHCHKTKKIRGLLCRNCNSALGKLNDDINLMYSMINYIKLNS